MFDEKTRPQGEENQAEGTKFPEWMAQMMSACGPEMKERMAECCSNMQAFANCCGSQPEKQTTQKA